MAEARRPQLPESWLQVLGPEFDEPYMKELRAFLAEEKREHVVFPPGPDIFAAFAPVGFEAVRVVLLGQDPYHGPGQAHGLCFSVRRGVEIPPSLRNIYKELQSDLGIPPRAHGALGAWARQGVLLLNTTLTVRAHVANSHRERGWERFTDRVIFELERRRSGLVFVLWGAAAGRKASMIDASRHLVLTAPHPSPLSANKGFFGRRPFSTINRWLTERGEAPINWDPDAPPTPT